MVVLTPLFLMFYIYKLFNQAKASRKFCTKYEGLTWTELGEKAKTNPTIIKDMSTIIVVGFGEFFIMIVEFIYICNAFAIDKRVSLAFLIFWFIILFKNIRVIKKSKTKNREHVVVPKWKLSQFLINTIDVAFFGYMFYVLMIK